MFITRFSSKFVCILVSDFYRAAHFPYTLIHLSEISLLKEIICRNNVYADAVGRRLLEIIHALQFAGRECIDNPTTISSSLENVSRVEVSIRSRLLKKKSGPALGARVYFYRKTRDKSNSLRWKLCEERIMKGTGVVATVATGSSGRQVNTDRVLSDPRSCEPYDYPADRAHSWE